MEAFVLPALLVFLSSILRSFIVNKSSTPSVLGEIALGIPVDLTFVALSVAISSSFMQEYWLTNRATLIIVMLIIAAIQLGAIYKPCKEYIDEDENLYSFGLWFLNVVITFSVFCFLVIWVVK